MLGDWRPGNLDPAVAFHPLHEPGDSVRGLWESQGNNTAVTFPEPENGYRCPWTACIAAFFHAFELCVPLCPVHGYANRNNLAAEPQSQLYPVCGHKESCSMSPLGKKKSSGCIFGGPPCSSLHTINSMLTAPWESMEDVDSSAECCLRRNRIHLCVG